MDARVGEQLARKLPAGNLAKSLLRQHLSRSRLRATEERSHERMASVLHLCHQKSAVFQFMISSDLSRILSIDWPLRNPATLERAFSNTNHKIAIPFCPKPHFVRVVSD